MDALGRWSIAADEPRRELVRSHSSLVLGFRFFALAAVAGIAAFLPRERVALEWVVGGVFAAVVVAVAQHTVFSRGRDRAWVFSMLHLLSWTALLHGTGGKSSPLLLGYLLELPLSGALHGRAGVIIPALFGLALYGTYATTIGGPLEVRGSLTFVLVLAICAAITWRAVVMLERQRAQIEHSQRSLTSRADQLADELHRLGDVLGDALVSIDDAGRVADLNPASLALLGLDRSGAVGRPWPEVLPFDPDSRRRLLETLDSGKPHRGLTMVLARPFGSSLTVRAEIWRGSGSRVHLLLDPGATAIADDPVRRLGESAACVAHQIRNSMHSIQGYVGTLGGEPSARAQTADECLGALRGLGALADDVLAMAGAGRPAPERVAIQDVLRSALVLLGQPPVRLAVPKSRVYVQARRSPLVHAVFNLIDNAVQASPAGEAVRVCVERHDGIVLVDIADAGPGIPVAIARAAGPVPSTHGTGLGLMAARRFVESCGGVLSLTASESGGTRCRLELPAAHATTSPATP